MTTPGRPRCAEVAEAAGDPVEASAPPVAQWFLVEHPGPWGRVALSQSGVHADAVTALSGWARREGGRVLLVRRSGRAGQGDGPRRWFRIDSRPGHEDVRTGLFGAERELAATVGEVGEPYDGPLHLVCTHGRHDTCCAVRGRPLAAALEAANPGRTWECSHLGGCRFAAALVALPHGYVFGRVSASAGVETVRRYRAGELDTRGLRGRSSLPPVVQAAQHHARAATGAFGVDAVAPVGMQARGTAGWCVELADPDCTVVLRERSVAAGRPLTCAATALGRMRVFDLVEIAF